MDDDVSLSSSYFRDYSNKKNNITLTLSLFFSKAPRQSVFSYARVCVCDSNLVLNQPSAKFDQNLERKKIERHKNTRKHY
tara:strand:- start:3045 stop:3284 length:240 start_codon:yes stop_codon:yes gene_type:complete